MVEHARASQAGHRTGMVTTVSIRYSMCSMENTHVCTSRTTQISTLSPSPTSRNLVPLLLRPLRSGSGSAQVYSLCSRRCSRVKRNCQLLTSSKIGSRVPKHSPYASLSLCLPACLPACLMLVPIYIVVAVWFA